MGGACITNKKNKYKFHSKDLKERALRGPRRQWEDNI